MSGYEPYDIKYAVMPTGLQNTGVICYFNSLLQGLLSCTSLNKLILTNQTVRDKNSLTKKYAEMLTEMKISDKNPDKINKMDLSKWSPIIWNEFKAILDARRIKFGNGQEDANEGLQLFIDCFQSPEVDQLFTHRFKSIIVCRYCNKVCSSTSDEGLAVEMYVTELKSTTPQNYMLTHIPPIDDDFICTVCQKKGNKIQKRSIVMIPEVLILQFKKYDSKWLVDFPSTLEFPGIKPGSKLEYKQIAQTEHAGGQNGGHYWARALRADNKIYSLNDTSFTESNWGATPETYLVWYHLI